MAVRIARFKCEIVSYWTPSVGRLSEPWARLRQLTPLLNVWMGGARILEASRTDPSGRRLRHPPLIWR